MPAQPLAPSRAELPCVCLVELPLSSTAVLADSVSGMGTVECCGAGRRVLAGRVCGCILGRAIGFYTKINLTHGFKKIMDFLLLPLQKIIERSLATTDNSISTRKSGWLTVSK